MPTTTGPRTSIKNRNTSPTQPFTNWIKGEGFLKPSRPLKPSGKIYFILTCQNKSKRDNFHNRFMFKFKKDGSPATPHPNRPKKQMWHIFKNTTWSLYSIFFTYRESVHDFNILSNFTHKPVTKVNIACISFLSVLCSGIPPPPFKKSFALGYVYVIYSKTHSHVSFLLKQFSRG